MFKTIYKNCAGIDVHKRHIVVRIAKTNEHDVTEYQLKTFSTFTDDLIECRNWLIDNDTLDVCMESTGKYWIPVYNILEENVVVFFLILNMLEVFRARKLINVTL